MEIWKVIPSHPKYEVSDFGNVRRIGLNRQPLKSFVSSKGYLKVNLHGTNLFVHRLVLLAFRGPSELYVNHINGVKTDNRIHNLEYVTPRENAHHAVRMGLIPTKPNEPGETVGSLYVLSSPRGFRVMRTFYASGKRCQRSVPRAAWYALGFSDSMTLEQARSRASQLNSDNTIKREERHVITGIAARVERDRLHHSTFIPEDLNNQFIAWLEVNTSGTADYVEKQKIIWGTAKKAIIKLQLLPEHFSSHKKAIFRYLSTRQYSGDYVRKLTSLMNQYGRFCARLTGKYYEPIPAPRGSEREMINDAYRESTRYRGPSDPLTPAILEEIKSDLPAAQYNWLFVTVWLALRPDEASTIAEDRKQRYWKVEPGDTDVLSVYQSKLSALPEPLRWKHIPIKYPEQKQALAILFEGTLESPLVKTIKSHTDNEHINRYGGRKGFVDLMLDRGESLEAISSWMGHTTIQMTWVKYKNKRRVNYGLKLA